MGLPVKLMTAKLPKRSYRHTAKVWRFLFLTKILIKGGLKFSATGAALKANDERKRMK
ncbi:hypothetical protein [Desulfosporosinus sp. FKB]|uniref:hypothetical protein n=1 Tax=Desulfosporosinus sp. FKB TaxID=1969835 RepID=UPI0014838B02|nr:hypothetical protein [Desulfosporosinus sp. FKB]